MQIACESGGSSWSRSLDGNSSSSVLYMLFIFTILTHKIIDTPSPKAQEYSQSNSPQPKTPTNAHFFPTMGHSPTNIPVMFDNILNPKSLRSLSPDWQKPLGALWYSKLNRGLISAPVRRTGRAAAASAAASSRRERRFEPRFCCRLYLQRWERGGCCHLLKAKD